MKVFVWVGAEMLHPLTARSSPVLFRLFGMSVSVLLLNFSFKLISARAFRLNWCRIVFHTASRRHLCWARQQDLRALVQYGLRWISRYIILVIIVALEQLLHAVSSQLGLTLFNSLRIFPLLVVYVVAVEIVHVDVWHELRMYPS